MAVLPIAGRWRLDTTCLVIGTLAPDFEYFAHGRERGVFSHTLLGIFAWGVPVTLVLAVAWHALVKWPLLAAAPQWIARRTVAIARRPWRPHWLACLVSAAIGAATHIGWDGGTHAHGWGERHFPEALDHMVTVPVLGAIPIFRVLQHASSLIGLAVLTAYVVVRLRREPPIEIELPRLRTRLIFAACIAAGIAAVVGRAIYIIHATDPRSLVVATISGTLAGTLVASALLVRAARPRP